MKSSVIQGNAYREISLFPTGPDTFVSGFLSSHVKRMGLITFSCVAIALAGILTRASFAIGEHVETAAIPNAPMAQPLEPVRAETAAVQSPALHPLKNDTGREVQFARKQLKLYTTLLESLQVRMNEEPSVDHLTRMRAALASLDQNLEQSREALSSYQTSKTPFTEEDLKGQLFALQDSGQRAVSVFVDADNFPNEDETLQAFKVSRTGQ